ncbi:MAG: 4-hydroxy-tetrahydrodipicolinate synthase [Negativicutes bacterium]|nr:4-hydroxy-tetrahydrodipicolinate synthase [Negativicutes bacterium]
MSNHFGRVITAMVTPFTADGRVDYNAAARLANFLIDTGSDGVVVSGSTGEAATLSDEEKINLFRTVVEAVGGRGTVIAGTGTNDTRDTVMMTQEAEKIGANLAMVVGPYYNKPTQEGYVRHFRTVAENTGLPIMIYNVPGRTAGNILPATVAQLSQISNIVAIKEASGNLEQVSEIARLAGDSFMIYSGDDILTLPMLALGARGVVSVAGHVVASPLQKMIAAFLAGDLETARTEHLRLVPFFRAIFCTTNPIPIKAAVSLLGQCQHFVRSPLVEASPAEFETVRRAMNDLGLTV